MPSLLVIFAWSYFYKPPQAQKPPARAPSQTASPSVGQSAGTAAPPSGVSGAGQALAASPEPPPAVASTPPKRRPSSLRVGFTTLRFPTAAPWYGVGN